MDTMLNATGSIPDFPGLFGILGSNFTYLDYTKPELDFKSIFQMQT